MKANLIDQIGNLAMRYSRAGVKGKQKILTEVQKLDAADREMFVTIAAFYHLLTICES